MSNLISQSHGINLHIAICTFEKNLMDLFTFIGSGTVRAVIFATDLIGPKSGKFFPTTKFRTRVSARLGIFGWAALPRAMARICRVRAFMTYHTEKIEIQGIIAGMTAKERREYLDTLFIFVAMAVELCQRADLEGALSSSPLSWPGRN
jgi:hypothetical protein